MISKSCMRAIGAVPSAELLARIWRLVDPRLREVMKAEFEAMPRVALEVKPTQKVVLVGHRAAGKSILLPLLAEWTGRPGIDLDAEVSARHDRPLPEWVVQDEAGFRKAERATFEALPNAAVIAAGGGFLSNHGATLTGHVAVLVPISRETYRERLLPDATRPRLRPDLSASEEVERVYSERELQHAKVTSIQLAAFLRATEPMR